MPQSLLDNRTPNVQLRFARIVCFFMLLLGVGIGANKAAAQAIGDELILNGGFEQLASGVPTNWIALNGWTNPEISLSINAAYAGSKGIAIQTTQSTKPWIVQTVPYEEGATYELSTWLKGTGIQGTGIGFKVEYYRGQVANTQNHMVEYDKILYVANSELTGDWQKITKQVNTPPEAGNVKIYLRLYGTGAVNFDEVSFVLKKHKPMIEWQTDELIYYSDVTEGQVHAIFNSKEGPLSGMHAEGRIYRESTGVTMATYSIADASNPLAFAFDPSMMVKNEPYRVEVKLLTNSNVLMESVTGNVYRLDRPTMLQVDGTLTVNGAPFFPVGGYHVGLSDYPFVSQAGVNVVQGIATNNADVQQMALDFAQANGLKVMVPLYYNMQVQENAALTQQFVTLFKDHPAILAWMIMDEPIYNGKSKEELIEAYRSIRAIDAKHPVYMVEAPLPQAYETTARIADIFATDSYPLPNNPISWISDHTQLGKQAAGDNKPVWTVLQAMYNPNHPYLPSIDEVRNMAYQSVVNGAQGLAYYSFNETNFQLRNSALWPGLIGFKDELALLGRLVTEAERIAGGQQDDSRWTLWRDGGVLYAAAVNTSEEIQQVTVPLGATGYSANLLYGGSQTSFEEQTDTLSIQLGPKQALMYRIVMLQALIQPATLPMDHEGSYPFAITIANTDSVPLQLSLEASQLPAGLSMQLPGSFSLPANQQTTVTGSVYLLAGTPEGEFQREISIHVDGDYVRSLPLPVNITYNLLENSGFEQGSGVAPTGWFMRQGSLSEVHSGNRAVALAPDSGNPFNVINSTGFIPVENGSKYVLRGWVKNESTTGLVSIGLRQVKQDQIASVNYTWNTIANDTDWTYYELEIMPQATAKYVQVYLSVDMNTNGIAWFDDMHVEKILIP